jgi:hypothetical protein
MGNIYASELIEFVWALPITSRPLNSRKNPLSLRETVETKVAQIL